MAHDRSFRRFYCQLWFLGGGGGSAIGGALGDRWGRKRTIITSVVVYSVGSFLCAQVKTPLWFACFRILGGLGMGMTLQNEVALVSEYFPAKYRQAGVSGVAIGMQIGGIMSALVAIRLVQPYGWQAAYYFGALPIVLVPVLIKFMPEAPWILVVKKRERELKETLHCLSPETIVPADASFEYPKAQVKSSLANVFAEHRLLSTILFWTIYFANVFVIYGTNTWIPKLMMNSGWSMAASSWILLSLFAGAGIASPIFGHWADRFSAKRVSLLCYGTAFVTILLLCRPMSFWVTMLVVALVGACTMGTQNLTHAYISQYFPPTVKSTMMGWGLAIGRFGGGLGPIVGGVLLSMHVSLLVSFLAFAAPCLVSAVAIFLVQDQYAYQRHNRPEANRAMEMAARP